MFYFERKARTSSHLLFEFSKGVGVCFSTKWHILQLEHQCYLILFIKKGKKRGERCCREREKKKWDFLCVVLNVNVRSPCRCGRARVCVRARTPSPRARLRSRLMSACFPTVHWCVCARARSWRSRTRRWAGSAPSHVETRPSRSSGGVAPSTSSVGITVIPSPLLPLRPHIHTRTQNTRTQRKSNKSPHL